MTKTPRWNRDEIGKTPTGLPPVGKLPNLSDYDVTQPSLRVAGIDRSQQGNSPKLSAPTSADASQPAVDYSVTRVNTVNVDPLVGTTFADRYEVIELLGRGGMGAVYKVRNRINKNLRALKLMHAHLVSDPQVFRRFQQEATAVARINHPNAITIIDMGMAADGRPYLVMDFLDGMSMAELVKYKKKLPIKDALPLFIQMCGALTEAHSHGVIHRDIKPSNVMLIDSKNTHQYVVKVVDFGIAKVFPQEGDPTMKDTTTGELFGSPPYMSPEQCLGKRLDYRSDIYSLGCLMYEVITGAPPLVGENALGTMYRQINESPTPLNSSDDDDDVRLTQRLDEIVSKTLRKDPAARYQSIAALQNDLQTATEVSGSRLKFVSSFGLISQAVSRAFFKRVAGSKKAGLVAIVSMASVFLFGSWWLLSMLMEDASSQTQISSIHWQSLSGKRKASEGRILDALQSVRLKEVQSAFGSASQEALHEQFLLAESYYLANDYSKALSQFQICCELGNELMFKNFFGCKNKKAALQDFCAAQLRKQQCDFVLHGYDRARNDETNSSLNDVAHSSDSLTAKKTLDYINQNGMSQGIESCYLNAVVGLNAKARGADSNDEFESLNVSLNLWGKNADQKIVTYIEDYTRALGHGKKDIELRKLSTLFAPSLAAIADKLAKTSSEDGRTDATRAYEFATRAWQILDGQGWHNEAVAYERLGLLNLRRKHYLLARSYFKIAIDKLAQSESKESQDLEVLFKMKAVADLGAFKPEDFFEDQRELAKFK